MGCVRGGQQTEYWELVDRSAAAWCGNNPLLFKCGEDEGDGCEFQEEQGEEVVEVVEGYRFLGDHLDNRLDWKWNTEAFYRKGLIL